MLTTPQKNHTERPRGDCKVGKVEQTTTGHNESEFISIVKACKHEEKDGSGGDKHTEPSLSSQRGEGKDRRECLREPITQRGFSSSIQSTNHRSLSLTITPSLIESLPLARISEEEEAHLFWYVRL